MDTDEEVVFVTQSTFTTTESDPDNYIGDELPCVDDEDSKSPAGELFPNHGNLSDEDLSQALDMFEGRGNTTCGRFRSPKRDQEIEVCKTRSLASSTRSKCKWATDMFESWRIERNKLTELDKDISKIHPSLCEMTKDELCYSVSRFLCEVRKISGEEYPPSTLYSMTISIQLGLELQGRFYKLLQDPEFLQIKNTLDHLMKSRVQSGVIDRNRKAGIITIQEEEILWSGGFLGTKNPRVLVDTMLYLNGLHFALRAGQEHRNLRWDNSQISLLTNANGERCLRYDEDYSKANQGGLKHRKVKRKTVYAFEDQKPDRCIVNIFMLYMKRWQLRCK